MNIEQVFITVVGKDLQDVQKIYGQKNGEEYETKLSLYNNNFGGFIDFTTELSYSKQDKDKLTFKFAIKLDNWLKIDTTLSDDGARNHRIGIDKIVDLKIQE